MMNKEIESCLPESFYQDFSNILFESQNYDKVDLATDTKQNVPNNFSIKSDNFKDTLLTESGHGPFKKYADQSVRFYATLNNNECFLGNNHPLEIKYRLTKKISNLSKFSKKDNSKVIELHSCQNFKYFFPFDMINNVLGSKNYIYSIKTFENDQVPKNSIVYFSPLDFDLFDKLAISKVKSLLSKIKENNNYLIFDQQFCFSNLNKVSLCENLEIEDKIDAIFTSHQFLLSGLFIKSIDQLNKFENINIKKYSYLNRYFFEKAFALISNEAISGHHGKIEKIHQLLTKNLSMIFENNYIVGSFVIIKDQRFSESFCKNLFLKGLHVTLFKNHDTIGFRLPLNIKDNELSQVCDIITSTNI